MTFVLAAVLSHTCPRNLSLTSTAASSVSTELLTVATGRSQGYTRQKPGPDTCRPVAGCGSGPSEAAFYVPWGSVA